MSRVSKIKICENNIMWKIILILTPFLISTFVSATPSHARSACNCGKVSIVFTFQMKRMKKFSLKNFSRYNNTFIAQKFPLVHTERESFIQNFVRNAFLKNVYFFSGTYTICNPSSSQYIMAGRKSLHYIIF